MDYLDDLLRDNFVEAYGFCEVSYLRFYNDLPYFTFCFGGNRIDFCGKVPIRYWDCLVDLVRGIKSGGVIGLLLRDLVNDYNFLVMGYFILPDCRTVGYFDLEQVLDEDGYTINGLPYDWVSCE